MPAALTRFVQACFTAADATTDKAAMMVCNPLPVLDHVPRARVHTCMQQTMYPYALSYLHEKQDKVSNAFCHRRQAYPSIISMYASICLGCALLL